MFSEQDALEAFRLIPPPPESRLVLSATGHGFITEKSLFHKLEHLLTEEPDRLSLSLLSGDVDVDTDVILNFIKTHPHLALLSENQREILPAKQRSSLQRKLEDLVTQQAVSKSAFSQDNDISKDSVKALTGIQSDGADRPDSLVEVDDYVFSRIYETALKDAIEGILDQSLQDAEPVELSSSMLPGAPPTWLIQRSLQHLASVDDKLGQFHITESDNDIRCVPRQSVARKRDAAIAQLQSGEVSCLDRRRFASDFKEIYQSDDEVDIYFASIPSISLQGDFAISRAWVDKCSSEQLRSLEQEGSVDLAVSETFAGSIIPLAIQILNSRNLESTFALHDSWLTALQSNIQEAIPQAVQSTTIENVAQRISTAYSSKSEPPVHRLGTFLITEERYNNLRDTLLGMAKTQASNQWETLKQNTDKDPKLHLSEILAAVPSDRSDLRAVAQEKSTESSLTEAFTAELSDLESQIEAEFSVFWIEKLLSRMHNYTAALESVEDTKLHDQLAELLSAYLQKELIPDTAFKAQAQGLARSRKTRKNVQKLEAALKAGKSDLASVRASVEKFGKKQGIQDPDTTTLVDAKNVLVNDMIRRMQKPKTDGPLLFLTLVIVLFAKHYPGVVYATGKFAPKLLKILKSNLNAEDYEKVENWKEQAKAGSLTSEDKIAILEMTKEV